MTEMGICVICCVPALTFLPGHWPWRRVEVGPVLVEVARADVQGERTPGASRQPVAVWEGRMRDGGY